MINQKLIAFIESHGHTARMLNGQLFATGVEVDGKLPQGHPDRVVYVEKPVDSTLSAVKDWLGY